MVYERTKQIIENFNLKDEKANISYLKINTMLDNRIWFIHVHSQSWDNIGYPNWKNKQASAKVRFFPIL